MYVLWSGFECHEVTLSNHDQYSLSVLPSVLLVSVAWLCPRQYLLVILKNGYQRLLNVLRNLKWMQVARISLELFLPPLDSDSTLLSYYTLVWIYYWIEFFFWTGNQPGAALGPLISPQAKERVCELVHSSVDEGATVSLTIWVNRLRNRLFCL